MTPELNAVDVARAIQATDYLRRPNTPLPGLGAHKEWHHFLIYDGAYMLLLNFSLSEEQTGAAPQEQTMGRFKLLEYDAEFSGCIELFQPSQLRAQAGAVDVRFGANSIAFVNGQYELSLELEEGKTRIELSLVPHSMPILTNNLALAVGHPLSWLVVPRLRAWGLVQRGGNSRRLQDAPTYHDHNWGYFRWGDDFTWEWGTVIAPDLDGWSFNMVRITNRARTKVLLQSFYLWHGPRLVRAFRDREMEIVFSGTARPLRVFKLPHVMGLLHPDVATDVPPRVSVRCGRGSDHVSAELELTALAQILMPDECESDTVTILNQCMMQVKLTGIVDQDHVQMEAPGVFEFIRG